MVVTRGFGGGVGYDDDGGGGYGMGMVAVVVLWWRRVWKSVCYGVSKGLDTAYWWFLGVGPRLISSRIFTCYISDTAYWSSLDTAYWASFLCGLWWVQARIRRIFLDGYDVLVFRILIFKISSFKLQNARLLLIFIKYSVITAILKYK
ncbi:hypothetical protein Tco_0169642 [Tanacetum coccineum]